MRKNNRVIYARKVVTMKKRMKRSSIIFLAIFVFLLGSVSVFAASSFSYNLAMPRTDYVMGTKKKTVGSSSSGYSSVQLTSSDCEAAYTMFWVKDCNDEVIASKYLYLVNSNKNMHLLEFLDAYKYETGNMQLMARTASEHTGYTIKGQWEVNITN